MKIGYACLTQGVYGTNFKTCTLKNATEDCLREIIAFNLQSLSRVLDYNIKNNIKLFRISSDIIPFGSSPVNSLKWWEEFQEELEQIGNKIKKSKMRVSMHPGQYTVLNSPKEDVVKRATLDLEYHTRFLDSLVVDSTHKIILHVGGVYGNKREAIERFKENYLKLPRTIKNRLVIENDDKSYTIADILMLGESLDIPVVYDNLHNHVLNTDSTITDNEWIQRARLTWHEKDGLQKIHYSQQRPNGRPGSHSQTIDLSVFETFLHMLTADVDIMFEVKDKNLSALKGVNYLRKPHIKYLEQEWSRYKYNVLAHAPQHYQAIRQLLKDKSAYPIVEFYHLIDESLATKPTVGQQINACEHVWGYFKDQATDKERTQYTNYLNRFKKGQYTIKALKRLLLKFALKYEQTYLIESYYFYID